MKTVEEHMVSAMNDETYDARHIELYSDCSRGCIRRQQ